MEYCRKAALLKKKKNVCVTISAFFSINMRISEKNDFQKFFRGKKLMTYKIEYKNFFKVQTSKF